MARIAADMNAPTLYHTETGKPITASDLQQMLANIKPTDARADDARAYLEGLLRGFNNNNNNRPTKPDTSERLCDLLLNLTGNNGMREDTRQLLPAIRDAQKFFFSTEQHELWAETFKTWQGLYATIPSIACPFHICWLEWSFPKSNIYNDISHGMLVISDETLMKGKIYVFYHRVSEVIARMIPEAIFFDFKPYVENIYATLDEMFFLENKSRENDLVEWEDIIGEFMLHIGVLNLPKRIITLTKEDFTEHNRLRRSLGQHKKQRQEYHLVNISLTKTELDAEVAAMLKERREYQGGTHASPGEHDVRGHWSISKLGRRYWRNPFRRGSGPLKTSAGRKGYQLKTGEPS